MGKSEKIACQNAITEMLSKGAISRCKPCPDQFISSYFLREKQNGEKRFIFNLKKLNKFIDTPHFKIENLRTALKLLSKNCYMATIDLKDGYFHIPIRKKDRKYLRFIFEGTLYEFNVLPFGLSPAPCVFTKLIKPVVHYLRSKGLCSVVYIDDFLLISEDLTGCEENVRATIELLEYLGFIINKKKSRMKPCQVREFLGLILDSQNYKIYLTDRKREKIGEKIKQLLKAKREKIRKVAKIIGTLTSACAAVNYGWLYTKLLERGKYLALKSNGENYNRKMEISQEMKSDLKWWLKNIEVTYNPIRNNIFKLEIFTDASLTGWGSALQSGEKARGWWTGQNKNEHINILELRAALNGLKCFARNESNCEILLRIDNTTAIAYINKMGGIQHKSLYEAAKEIWQWCEAKNIHIYASYINTKDNYLADSESRSLPPETEWELANWAFNQIVDAFGNPEVDLFASHMNAKCKTFVSWKKDPESWAVDAFTISWKDKKFYAFPPFSLILRTLRKIAIDKAEGIVVVPYWPAQPWFPLFKKLAQSNIINLEAAPNLLTSPFREKHPLANKLSLAAAVLSSKLSPAKDIQKK